MERIEESPSMDHPVVSIIVVNWNRREYVGECLNSLRSQSFRDFEVILVDNGSTEGSVEFIEENFPGFVRILKNKENVGFARGNNQGIEVSRSEERRVGKECRSRGS